MLYYFDKNSISYLKNLSEIYNIPRKKLNMILKSPYKTKIESKEPLSKLTEDILKQYGIEL